MLVMIVNAGHSATGHSYYWDTKGVVGSDSREESRKLAANLQIARNGGANKVGNLGSRTHPCDRVVV